MPFGERFDQLFAKALGEIKQFAQALDEMGGSILSTVDGVEVTVEHVAAIEQNEMLKADYSNALEKFRRVSQFEKRARSPSTDPQVIARSGGRKCNSIFEPIGSCRKTGTHRRCKSTCRGPGVSAAGDHCAANLRGGRKAAPR